MVSAMDRFMQKVAKTSGCWIWTGVRNVRTGRAYFKEGVKSFIAARWFWQQMFGPIPIGRVVMHRCDNPACVNPGRLSLGTQIENIADRDAKGRNRLSATHCVNGHEFTEENTRLYGPGRRWRMCKACAKQRSIEYRNRLKE